MYIPSYFNLSAVRIHLTTDNVLIFIGNALIFLSFLEVRRRMVDLTIRGISDFFFFKYGSGFNKCTNDFNSPNRFTKILALSQSLGLQG